MPPIAKARRRDDRRHKAQTNLYTSRTFLLILDQQSAKRDRRAIARKGA